MPQDKPSSAQPLSSAYRVLARKYRPGTLDALIGQESLVQTLSNALSMGRLAHAFVLTGLRGIGKTTTARIIAKGLNCTGADGRGEPTLNPCGVCSSCVDIDSGRHVDVVEMDAASHTGVEDIREILDGVGYAPLSARFKIYIVDEVHMLSKSAFNALLKTLEEPPESVKFVFATTEIRKVPVTVLSRCQRFDLRRVPADMLAQHLAGIAEKESIKTDQAALLRIARAAEGSVRDGLSLLDQAAALTSDSIDDASVAAMLGQAGRMDALNITRAVLQGDTEAALAGMKSAISSGAEAAMVIGDMLEFIHLASRLVTGSTISDLPDAEKAVLEELAQASSVSRLARAWQIALKGHGEVNLAPNPAAAADMVLIRMTHASTLPSPAELVGKLSERPRPGPASTSPASAAESPTSAASASSPDSASDRPPEPESGADNISASNTAAAINDKEADDREKAEPQSRPAEPAPIPETLEELAHLFTQSGEVVLASQIHLGAKLVTLKPGHVELAADSNLTDETIARIGRLLSEWTGIRWSVSKVSAEGGLTLDEKEAAHRDAIMDRLSGDPLVKATMERFPDARITRLTPLPGELETGEPEAGELATGDAATEDESDAPEDEGASFLKADHA